MGFLTRNARFVYLIAGLCSLYIALVPLLSGGRGSTLFIGFWIGAALLLFAAIIPLGERRNVVLSVLALGGSTLITAILFYDIASFGTLRFSFTRLVGVPYQPTTFDRVSQVLTKPVLIVLVISSVASLLMSALITVHLRRPESQA
jgi:hypothetical protein